MYKKFIMKAHEEKCGETFFEVIIPGETPDDEIKKSFEMASKYATLCPGDDDASEYDEHFDEMNKVREGSNGLYAFKYYIDKICQWKIAEIIPWHFEFEW